MATKLSIDRIFDAPAVFNLGTERLSPLKASKIKITNILALITCCVALLYALYFLLVLENLQLALGNIFFVLSYSLTLFLNYKRVYRSAKVWFFCVFMTHVLILNIFIFSVATGFHFYYLVLPAGVFLLFDYEDKFEKIALCFIGIVLFFVCDSANYYAPLIALEPEAEKILFSFVIIITMSEVYLIMYLLSRNISAYEKELNTMATTDALTGIKNRRIFMAIGEGLLEEARRYSRSFSLLLLDIDLFKNINDSHGHIVGDQALKKVALVLQSNLRTSDYLARYGGEEFVVILPETGIHHATELAEKLRVAVSMIELDLGQGRPLSFTTSVGLAEYNADTKSLLQLLDQADKALYEAKDMGRNKVVVYQP
ncbi:MAG: diguanylate cyclase (GGDEF)-like protein [Paraglaciecola sp.]|jgi:diguanylate cyclase (GGDEF)-like protein